jgi:hypothetical protein
MHKILSNTYECDHIKVNLTRNSTSLTNVPAKGHFQMLFSEAGLPVPRGEILDLADWNNELYELFNDEQLYLNFLTFIHNMQADQEPTALQPHLEPIQYATLLKIAERINIAFDSQNLTGSDLILRGLDDDQLFQAGSTASPLVHAPLIAVCKVLYAFVNNKSILDRGQYLPDLQLFEPALEAVEQNPMKAILQVVSPGSSSGSILIDKDHITLELYNKKFAHDDSQAEVIRIIYDRALGIFVPKQKNSELLKNPVFRKNCLELVDLAKRSSRFLKSEVSPLITDIQLEICCSPNMEDQLAQIVQVKPHFELNQIAAHPMSGILKLLKDFEFQKQYKVVVMNSLDDISKFDSDTIVIAPASIWGQFEQFPKLSDTKKPAGFFTDCTAKGSHLVSWMMDSSKMIQVCDTEELPALSTITLSRDFSTGNFGRIYWGMSDSTLDRDMVRTSRFQRGMHRSTFFRHDFRDILEALNITPEKRHDFKHSRYTEKQIDGRSNGWLYDECFSRQGYQGEFTSRDVKFTFPGQKESEAPYGVLSRTMIGVNLRPFFSSEQRKEHRAIVQKLWQKLKELDLISPFICKCGCCCNCARDDETLESLGFERCIPNIEVLFPEGKLIDIDLGPELNRYRDIVLEFISQLPYTSQDPICYSTMNDDAFLRYIFQSGLERNLLVGADSIFGSNSLYSHDSLAALCPHGVAPSMVRAYLTNNRVTVSLKSIRDQNGKQSIIRPSDLIEALATLTKLGVSTSQIDYVDLNETTSDQFDLENCVVRICNDPRFDISAVFPLIGYAIIQPEGIGKVVIPYDLYKTCYELLSTDGIEVTDQNIWDFVQRFIPYSESKTGMAYSSYLYKDMTIISQEPQSTPDTTKLFDTLSAALDGNLQSREDRLIEAVKTGDFIQIKSLLSQFQKEDKKILLLELILPNLFNDKTEAKQKRDLEQFIEFITDNDICPHVSGYHDSDLENVYKELLKIASTEAAVIVQAQVLKSFFFFRIEKHGSSFDCGIAFYEKSIKAILHHIVLAGMAETYFKQLFAETFDQYKGTANVATACFFDYLNETIQEKSPEIFADFISWIPELCEIFGINLYDNFFDKYQPFKSGILNLHWSTILDLLIKLQLQHPERVNRYIADVLSADYSDENGSHFQDLYAYFGKEIMHEICIHTYENTYGYRFIRAYKYVQEHYSAQELEQLFSHRFDNMDIFMKYAQLLKDKYISEGISEEDIQLSATFMDSFQESINGKPDWKQREAREKLNAIFPSFVLAE